MILSLVCLFDIVALSKKLREQCVTFAQDHLITDKNPIDQLFFTPDDSLTLKQIVLGLIDAEKTKIQVALFRLTDIDITQALIDAHKRGIIIEIIADTGAIGLDHYSKVSALMSNDIPIYVYQPIKLGTTAEDVLSTRDVWMERMMYQSIMHHKLVIFYNTIGGAVVFFGSLNLTYAAFNGNEELVNIRNDKCIVERCRTHFEKLKRRCFIAARSYNHS